MTEGIAFCLFDLLLFPFPDYGTWTGTWIFDVFWDIRGLACRVLPVVDASFLLCYSSFLSGVSY